MAMVLQSVILCSYNRTLEHSGTSHNISEQHNVKRLERTTDNFFYSSNNQGTFVEERQVCF